jgi:hypothetical protein
MPFDQDFEANPRAFLSQYAIVPMAGRIDDDQTGKKIVTGFFTLSVFEGMDPGGNAIGVLRLDQADSGLKAYWVAYEDDKAKRAMLGTEAKYMFTANMDGCSFGHGSKTGTGEVLVSHANAGGYGAAREELARKIGYSNDEALGLARSAQANEQARMLDKHMQPDSLQILHPSAYGVGQTNIQVNGQNFDIYKNAATVVGLRENGSWRFLCQRRVITERGQYVLRDVIDI